MTSLTDMLMQGGNGAAMEQIARHFDLSKAQAERAAEALLPAFSEGLKRNSADGAGFMRLMASLASGGQGNYFDNPADAASKDGRETGEAILGHLFGSKDVSRAVAAQAAQMSGLSQSILKQILPMLAPIVLGGLFKKIMGGTAAPRQANAGADNPLGQILEQMLGGGKRGAQPSGGNNPWGEILEEMLGGGQRNRDTPPQAPGGADNPLGKILEEMFGGGRSTGQRQTSPGERTGGQSGDNPLGDIFGEMLRGGKAGNTNGAPQEPYGGQDRLPEPEEPAPREKSYHPAPDGQPQPSTKGGLEDLFGEMFETGGKTPKDYQRGIEQIFEQLKGNKPRS